jgi:hypothetical protein
LPTTKSQRQGTNPTGKHHQDNSQFLDVVELRSDTHGEAYRSKGGDSLEKVFDEEMAALFDGMIVPAGEKRSTEVIKEIEKAEAEMMAMVR